MTDKALAEVVVVELAGGTGVAYCGKLLADLGARVIMVEDQSGALLRREGPTRAGAAHSGLFAHLALNKESLELDPREAADARLLESLLTHADILLTDGSSPFQDVLLALAPQRLITVDISDFGRSGPYSHWTGSDIAVWAMGGYMYFTGEKTREPLIVPGGQSALHGGMHAALAALAALYEQRRSNSGQHIEISNLEAVLSAHAWLTVAWTHAGTLLERTTHDLIRCKDGWFNFMRIVMYPNLFILIGRPELMDDPRWGDITNWIANNEELFAMVADWCKDKTCQEVYDAAQELRIACCPVNDARDLAESRQLAAREWWLDVDDQALGTVRLPGFPYRLTETPPAVSRPAPRLGEHSEAIRREFSSPAAPSSVAAAGRAGAGPLEGVRIVEVTTNWAGPVCGRHLGDLGAEIVKVELASRPSTRQGWYPKMDPQRQLYNRAGYFNQMNRNKRDVVLDLAKPEGKDAFIELIRRADIFIENNSARVMPNLGLDYETLSQHNPALIMVSMTGFGATGPERDYSAYGSNIEASCGLAALVGYGPEQPYRTNYYYADPVSGGHGAVALLAALEYRRRTGKGQWIDISLNECGGGFFAEALIDYQLNGTVQGPRGNRHPEHAPQGAYRCAGIDNWLALSVQNDAEWRRLCEVIGRPDLAEDAGLATADGRRARHEELDAAISSWCAGLEQYEAAWALQRAGVSAAPVLANWQMLPDPHLHHRGFYVDIEHPVVGVYPFPGWPWRLSRTPASVRRAAPLFAEHNRQVLREIGYSEDQVAALYEKGITADEPTGFG